MSMPLEYRGDVPCGEKSRLSTEYKAAVSVFSETVKEMRRRIGTTQKEQYKRLQRAANLAHAKSEQARLALEGHIASHRC